MSYCILNSEASEINESPIRLSDLQDILKGIPQIKLSYKSEQPASTLLKVSCSDDVEKAFRASWDVDNIEFIEEFKVMFLNAGNRVLGICEISKGGYTGTVVEPKLILSAAILTGCTAIVLAHNHPSGNKVASAADKKVTSNIKEAAKLMEIVLLDHIIITQEGFYSFADDGLI